MRNVKITFACTILFEIMFHLIILFAELLVYLEQDNYIIHYRFEDVIQFHKMLLSVVVVLIIMAGIVFLLKDKLINWIEND